MANFVPGDSSPIAQITPWSPDWSFLEQVYGVTQVRYDKGFNMVKNLYNSVLNSPLTNSDNQAFRNEMFQKIQASLKDVAALDLANPTNVMRAEKLLNPITDDKEFAYDMYVTKYHENQKKIMSSHCNSTDPKIRAKCNDYSKMDIQYAEDDLRKAKRGDGSITSVQPRDFVPFDDYNEYLNEQSKAAKLKVGMSETKGAYIYKYTNGEVAKKPFSVWAANALGNKFDKQFEVIGRVTAETQIRDLMAQGLTRPDAMKQIAAKTANDYKTYQTNFSQDVGNSLTEVQRQIDIIEKQYPNGAIPIGKKDLFETYNELLDARTELTKAKSAADGEVKKITEDPENYALGNIFSIYSNDAKNKAATAWGVSTAEATADVDIRPDQKVIADMNRQASIWKAQLASQTRLKIAQEQLEWDKTKQAQNLEFKNKALEQQKNLATAKKDKDGKAVLPEVELLGNVLGESVPGAEILFRSTQENRSKLFDAAFGANQGLINIVVPNSQDFGKYNSVLNKVKGIAQNSGEKLTDSEKGILKEYSKLVKMPLKSIEIDFNNQPEKASAYLEQLASNTFEVASNAYNTLAKTNSKDATKYIKSFSGSMTAMKSIIQEKNNIDDAVRRIANMVYDFNTKSLKPGYENAKIVSYNADGTPIIDIKGLEPGLQKAISTVISDEWNARGENPVGSIYNYTGSKADELYTLFNTEANKGIKISSESTISGEDAVPIEKIQSLILSNKGSLLGDQYKVAYDPGKQIVTVFAGIDAESKVAKENSWEDKSDNTVIKIEIPYSTIVSAPTGVMTRFKEGVKMNTINSESYGLMDAFTKKPFANVKAPSYLASKGMDYTFTGTTDDQGRYGINMVFKYYDPKKQNFSVYPRFVPVDQQDPESFQKAGEIANSIIDAYMDEVDAMDDDQN